MTIYQTANQHNEKLYKDNYPQLINQKAISRIFHPFKLDRGTDLCTDEVKPFHVIFLMFQVRINITD
jgi:hypothetical protein